LGNIRALFFLILIPCVAVGQSSSQEVITISDPGKLINIGRDVSFLIDSSASLPISEILKSENQKKFKPHDKQVFTLPSNDYAIWFKFTIQNETTEPIWIEAGANASYQLDFFRPDSAGNHVDSVLTGSMRPKTTKEFPVNFYWLRLADEQTSKAQTYYLRFASGLSVELPFYAGTLAALVKKKEKHDFLTAGYIGLMIIMILYNLFLGLATQDRIYVYYIAYLITMTITITFSNHYPFSNNPFWLENYFLWGSIFHFFASLFSTKYLDLQNQAPYLNISVWVITVFLSFVIPILTLLGVPSHVIAVPYYQIGVVSLYLSLLWSGIYLLFKGHKNARFYVLGWTFANLSFLLFFMTLDGWLPYNIVTRNAIYFGTAIEVFMFSLALADRFNTLKREKEEIQAEKLSIIQNQNRVLEKKVSERTAEIHHRVKNTLQIISSILNMHHRRIEDNAAQEVLVQTRNRVKSIGLIHEHLYKQEYLSKIDLEDYVKELIDILLQTLHKGKEVHTIMEVPSLKMDIEKIIPIGLILNELVTNCIKYAFLGNQNPQMKLNIEKRKNQLILLLSDNGTGAIEESSGEGFGQTIIRTLLGESGSMDTKKDEAGYHVTVTISLLPQF
tara:strand:+ start:41530 stop:43377 length:1848 start_codon:yes stop_codon:yes gene_type:complete